MTAEVLLSRLEKCRPSGPNHWTACCPAHKDKTPSLSIRELPDGRVLIHDFGGCSVEAILAAVGLEFADLYPEPLPQTAESRRQTRQGFDARAVLRSVAFETTVVLAAVGTLQRRGWLNDHELDRLSQAAERILGSISYVG